MDGYKLPWNAFRILAMQRLTMDRSLFCQRAVQRTARFRPTHGPPETCPWQKARSQPSGGIQPGRCAVAHRAAPRRIRHSIAPMCANAPTGTSSPSTLAPWALTRRASARPRIPAPRLPGNDITAFRKARNLEKKW